MEAEFLCMYLEVHRSAQEIWKACEEKPECNRVDNVVSTQRFTALGFTDHSHAGVPETGEFQRWHLPQALVERLDS